MTAYDPTERNPYLIERSDMTEQAAEARGPSILAQELAQVLNRYLMENASNTPDFLLAEYLERCLAAGEVLINRRDGWYGVKLKPGHRLVEAPRTESGDGVVDASIRCGRCAYDRLGGDEKFCPQCGVEFVGRTERALRG